MTINYTAKVATCGRFGCFFRLLFRWRGSIYKLVWMDLTVFLLIYYSLALIYCFALDKEQQGIFESIVKYCENNSLIPLSFVLGFYVTIVMTRWWAQYMAIPWPDSLAVYVSAHIQGHDERGRIFRRTVMRYACLCLTIALGNVCPRVKKRFPTWESYIDAGLLVENEKNILAKFSKMFPDLSFHWMPIVWSASIATRARREGRIRDDLALQTIVLELNKFRGNSAFPMSYTWISIPLVYTQVVTLAVYSYFACSLMAKQWVALEDNDGYMTTALQKYIPFFTTLEFFFYMGWLKVAESLINPFGDDDDDFEINWIIDRHLLVSYLIVDEMHHDHPELVRDQFWDEIFPMKLPYYDNDKREEPPLPSTAKIGLDRVTSDTQTKRLSRVAAYFTRTSRDRPTLTLTSPITSSYMIGVVPPQNAKMLQRSRRRSTLQSYGSSSSPSLVEIEESEDDFERLRKQRRNDRLERQRNNLLETVDNITNTVDKVAPIISLFSPQHLMITSTESEQSSNFVDASDEPTARQDNAKAKSTNVKSSTNQPTKINVAARDDFERLKKEREKRRNDRMKLKIAQSLQRFNITLKTSGSSVNTSISMKKSELSSFSSIKLLATASKRRFELKTVSSEVSSVYLDVENSSNENTARRPGFVPRSRSVPDMIRRKKSMIDLLLPQKQETATSSRRDDAKVTGSTSRPWLSKRSSFKPTRIQQTTAKTSKVPANKKSSILADAQHQASITTLTPRQRTRSFTEKEKTEVRDGKSMSTLTLQQRQQVEPTDSLTSSIYLDAIDSTFEATSRTTQSTTAVTAPTRRRVRLTQGHNVLPVASETSTLYADPDDEPSEEWHDPSGLSTKKKESKSK